MDTFPTKIIDNKKEINNVFLFSAIMSKSFLAPTQKSWKHSLF
jgi:hypothetical protein